MRMLRICVTQSELPRIVVILFTSNYLSAVNVIGESKYVPDNELHSRITELGNIVGTHTHIHIQKGEG